MTRDSPSLPSARPPTPDPVAPQAESAADFRPQLSDSATARAAAVGPATPLARETSGLSALGPFASAAFVYLWIGSVITMSGQFMQQVAQGWLVYELTGSSTWLGIVSFARGVPMLVLALPGGVLIDRFDRRRLLIISQGLAAVVAVILAALIASGLVQPWHILVTAFVSGSLMVLIFPTRQALVPATVERRQIGPAVALSSAGQNAGRVLGPSLAGLLISWLGVAACFFAQAGGFVAALLCTAQLKPQPAAGHIRSSSAVENLLDGLRYIRRDPTVFALMGLAAVPAFLAMPYQQLLPVFAGDILHAGPGGLGMLMAASGVGSLLGSIGVALLPTRRQGVMLFGSLAAFGGLLAAFSFSSWLPLSVGIMALMGVAQSFYMATNNTLLHLAAPDELRGRVMSAYMTTWGLMPLGSLPQGALADLFGAPVVVAGAGALCFAFTLLLATRYPALRRL